MAKKKHRRLTAPKAKRVTASGRPTPVHSVPLDPKMDYVSKQFECFAKFKNDYNDLLRQKKVKPENKATAKLRADLRSALFMSKEHVSREFFEAVIGLIHFLVRVNGDFSPAPPSRSASRLSDIELVRIFADEVASAIQQRLGDPYEFGGITFGTIAEIKQAYWSARESCQNEQRLSARAKVEIPQVSATSFSVLRVNNIPFAECVFAKLMQEHTGELGYVIQVIDVPYSEVGAALRTNHIDVALYNGSLKTQLSQLKGTERRFGSTPIFASYPLYRYSHYPVISSTCRSAENKISVPQNSDFELVIKEQRNARGKFSIGGVRLDSHDDVVYRESADAALADVVNGQIRFGIVGGLQKSYVRQQFSGQYTKHLDSGNKEKYSIKPLPRNLERKFKSRDNDENDAWARFWVSVDRRDQAADIINCMVAIWNEAVVQEWTRLCTALGDSYQTELLGFLNARQHTAFLTDFDALRSLIHYHDGPLERVDLGIDDSALNK